MRCPYCNYEESRVIDSRPTDDGEKIKRRRECLKCSKRFTTYEIIETFPLVVVKKDKSREAFDRNKLLTGLLKACEKRSIPLSELEKIVDNIEVTFQNSFEKEISSQLIGEYVMDSLKNVDKVAYIRFASVYRQFDDVDHFMHELKNLLKEKQ
ncbi:MAG: Transcriptional repressor NrdR [Eubacteriales bacterium SKADARSKE-1]|nr:Transcriptional repressor NrdR [Eubacteriales bacterium SKADARSKE-1]